MFGVMHNVFIDRVRSQRSTPEDSSRDELPESPDRAAPSDRLEVRDLDQAVQRPNGVQREALLLVGGEEMKYQEVASVMGVPIGTVMSRLSRARERLRAEFEGREVVSKIQRVK